MSIHYSSNSQEWATPLDFFNLLDSEFHFTLDSCATATNTKCVAFISPEENALEKDWHNGSDHSVVFMNPPYGRKIGLWVEKAYQESLKGSLIVCLLPARVDTKWFHDFCIKGEVRLMRRRLKFIGSQKYAPFPIMVVIFRPHGIYYDQSRRIIAWDWKAKLHSCGNNGNSEAKTIANDKMADSEASH